MNPRTMKLLDARDALDLPIEERDRVGCTGVPFADLENFIANTYSTEQCARGFIVRLERDEEWTVAPAPGGAVNMFLRLLSLITWNRRQPDIRT